MVQRLVDAKQGDEHANTAGLGSLLHNTRSSILRVVQRGVMKELGGQS